MTDSQDVTVFRTTGVIKTVAELVVTVRFPDTIIVQVTGPRLDVYKEFVLEVGADYPNVEKTITAWLKESGLNAWSAEDILVPANQALVTYREKLDK